MDGPFHPSRQAFFLDLFVLFGLSPIIFLVNFGSPTWSSTEALIIMVSQKLFNAYPPFPQDVPTADVPKFSLAKLSSGDSAYTHQLFETCRSTGFFLLEMGGDDTGDKMIEEIDAMFEISKNVFDLKIEEKSKYAQDTVNGKFAGYVTPAIFTSGRPFALVGK